MAIFYKRQSERKRFLSIITAPMYWRIKHSSVIQLSGRSSCQVIPAVWSFQLSVHSGCPVIPAVWSFWIFSDRSSHCKQHKLKKGTEQLTAYCLLSKKSRINFVGLSGNGNKPCKEKQQVQNDENPRSPSSQNNTQPLSSSLPTLFFVTTVTVSTF